MKKLPKRKLLHRLFNYNPETGQFFRKMKTKTKLVDTRHNKGYISIKIGKERYLAHRLAYVYMYGRKQLGNYFIDHINSIRNDNRINNLRLVTRSENNWNRPSAKGYYWKKQHQKWCSQIKVDGTVLHIGYYENEVDARLAYLEAKEALHNIIDRRKI